MKNISKTFLFTLFTLFILVSALTASIAWFETQSVTSTGYIYGSSEGAYFAYGNGKPYNAETGDRPFGIKNTRHLNNLAWLQYNGFFTDPGTCFELADDINGGSVQSPFVMPPIGTEANPFVGVFDGNNHTITNIKITNDGSIFSNKPNSITSYSSDDAEIVGFFGVVGRLDGASYESSVNSIQDVTFSNITVQSRTNNTLIGLAVGYVNAPMSNIKVSGNATIDVNRNTNIGNTRYSSDISEHGLVGYSTDKETNGSYSQTISRYYNNKNPSYNPGHAATEGGSLEFKETFDYLKSFRSNPSLVEFDEKQDVTTIPKTGSTTTREEIRFEDAFLKYTNGTDTSFTFSKGTETTDPNIVYLFGKRQKRHVTINEKNSKDLLFIKNKANTSFYTAVYNGTEVTIVARARSSGIDLPEYGWETSKNISTTPTSNTDFGTLSREIEVNGVTRTYYLGFNTSTRYATISTNTTNVTWGMYYTGSYAKVYAKVNSSYYYMNNTSLTAQFTTAKNSISNNGADRNVSASSISDTTNDDETGIYQSDFIDTYFPLNLGQETVNTGYIVGGGNYFGGQYPNNAGDVRVGRYRRNQSYSYGGDTHYNIDDITKVYTIDSSGKKEISSQMSGDDKNERMKKTYDSWKENIGDFSTGYYYGLHFMNASIGASKPVIPTAKINGKTFSNYEVPSSCIDFYFGSEGIINFLSGTYFNIKGEDENDAFFSLYKISRNNDNTIKSITTIDKIYKKSEDNDNPEDPNIKYASSTPDGYELAFDTSWLTNPGSNFSLSSLYYFEIPVLAGEYALGSISGHSGAYLMYLDIAANGSDDGSDNISAYKTTTTKTGYQFPKGIDFDVVSYSEDGGGSFAFAIPADNKGIISFGIASTSIAVTTNSFTSNPEYRYTSEKCITRGVSPGVGEFNVTGDTNIANLPSGTEETRTVITARATPTGGDEYTAQIIYDFDGSTTYVVNGRVQASASAFEENAGSVYVVLGVLNDLVDAITIEKYSGSSTFEVSLPDLPWAVPSTYVVTMAVAEDLSIDVTFADNTYTLTINGDTVLNNETKPTYVHSVTYSA